MPSSFFRSRERGGASLWHLLSRTAPRGQHQGHGSVPPWASPCNTQRLSWEGHCSSTSPACQPSPAPAQLSESHTGASGATESSGQPGTATSLPSSPPSPSSLSLVTPGGLVSPPVAKRSPEQAEQGAAQPCTLCCCQPQHLTSLGAAGKGTISFPPLPFFNYFVAFKRAIRYLLLCEPQQPAPSSLTSCTFPPAWVTDTERASPKILGTAKTGTCVFLPLS